ncbi:MAG: hypothetical protein P4L87_24250 [Formivibrio sp.]|nr:hypothetical protein [Formivibrio sp.]
MSKTINTNDTGIQLHALPTEEDDPTDVPSAADIPEPIPELEPEPIANQAEILRAQVIAAEDPKARRKMMLLLGRYYTSARFGKYLEAHGLVEDLSNLTIEEMQGLHKEIQIAVQNKTAGSMIQTAVPQVIAALEPLVSRVYDVAGVAANLSRDETFQDTLEEFALEHGTLLDAPVEKRLAFSILKGCIIQHEVNKYVAMQKAAAAAAAPDKSIRVSAGTADLLSS